MSFLNVKNSGGNTAWANWEKLLFRFLFIYFIIQAIPLDWKFYKELFAVFQNDFSFYSLFKLTKYAPQFFSATGFYNWLIAAALALIGTAVWTARDRGNVNYDVLHYWLRVILRYRLAAGIIAYGLIKLFPLQMPYPSLSNLHTNYGDFLKWKIYFHTLGITQGYEIFLGLVEIVAGILLLFRKGTTFGSGIILGFVGNVFAANIAYDGGEQVYSAYLFVIALFLFAYDTPRLFRLVVLRKYTTAAPFKPVYEERKAVRSRLLLKTAFSFFILALGISTYANYTSDPYKVPTASGLKDAYGFYNVREFRLNSAILPYSTTDTNRWQNVVFEKWATLSIKTAKPVKIDFSYGDEFKQKDIDRNFESAGVGGRHYFAYTIDNINNILNLQNKNRNHAGEIYKLQFIRPNANTIIVNGVNEKGDSVYAVLDKIERKYMLFEGRRKPIKL
jgi:hypothetical protein